jgi:phage terminase large subunit-like protein
MGLRGPGAKPKKAKDNIPAPVPESLTWEAEGLTRAERVIAFLESLPITAGSLAGQNMAVREWQRRDIIEPIYRVNDDGLRVVRTAVITLPRRQGKTAICAGLALAHLCGPEAEPRGQIFSAAADRRQAGLLYQEMKAIIQQVPYLEDRIIIRDFNKSLEDSITGSVYQVLAANVRTAHGLSASCVIYDELAQARDRQLWDVLSTSTAARKEPLIVVISTQNGDQNHIMSELVNYGRQVIEGAVEDPAFHGCIYSAPMDADPWSEETWRQCNPALGDFRSLEEMRTAAQQAQRIPARESAFRLLYLNQPVEAEGRFIASADWDQCGGPVEVESLRGMPCFGGLDLGSTQDLTALVLYFPHDGSLLLYCWVPKDNIIERETRDRVPYATWARMGHIELTNGRATDRLAICRRLAEIASTFDLQGLAFDRWRIEDLQKMLADEGIDLPMVPWGQGFKDMSPSVEEFERAVLQARLKHGGNPVLTWALSNAVVETDPAGSRKLSKAKSHERIDPIVAAIMAIGLHARQPAAQQFTFDRPLFISY